MADEDRITQLADEAHDWLTTRKRDNGEEFYTTKDGAPEWVTELLRDGAHDSARILPDDYRYRFAADALELLSQGQDDDDWEPEMYTHDLNTWLGSRLDRASYVEEAVEQCGWPGTLFAALSEGQRLEFLEVFHGVRSLLEERAEELEAV